MTKSSDKIIQNNLQLTHNSFHKVPLAINTYTAILGLEKSNV